MRRNYTDALLEEYMPKRTAARKPAGVNESLTEPRSYEELDAARAGVQAKISKLNIELAKLDAECAARVALDSKNNAEKSAAATPIEAKDGETEVKDEPVEAEKVEEVSDETAVEPTEETAAITTDPIEVPEENSEDDFDGLEGLAQDLEEAKKQAACK